MTLCALAWPPPLACRLRGAWANGPPLPLSSYPSWQSWPRRWPWRLRGGGRGSPATEQRIAQPAGQANMTAAGNPTMKILGSAASSSARLAPGEPLMRSQCSRTAEGQHKNSCAAESVQMPPRPTANSLQPQDAARWAAQLQQYAGRRKPAQLSAHSKRRGHCPPSPAAMRCKLKTLPNAQHNLNSTWAAGSQHSFQRAASGIATVPQDPQQRAANSRRCPMRSTTSTAHGQPVASTAFSAQRAV